MSKPALNTEVANAAPSSDYDASSPTLAEPSPSSVDKSGVDMGKLKAFLSILKKFIGVTDIAAVRFSLPAQLLEPTPNLEYWHYLDRPETFVSIGDSDDDLGRMLGALRFWFTKDLKYVKGKPCKPYNSALGEFFRCNWEVKEPAAPVIGTKSPDQKTDGPITISYITEQTSHHPPVSAYWIHCPQKGISGQGYDQLSANFTGTRIRVGPGEYNLGIFITLHNHGDEQYNLTHPTANLGGLLKGSLSVTVADTCYVTCPKTKMKAILNYVDEGWLGKNQNKVEGVIFKYDPEDDCRTKIKEVPEQDMLGRIEGSWQKQVYFTKGSGPFDKGDKTLLVDLDPLMPAGKIIPPETEQLPNESRKFWQPVTKAIHAKDFSQATTNKQEIEEKQRQKAADRKSRNVEWKPRFFTEVTTPVGRPGLSEEGKKALDGLQKGDFHLEPNTED